MFIILTVFMYCFSVAYFFNFFMKYNSSFMFFFQIEKFQSIKYEFQFGNPFLLENINEELDLTDIPAKQYGIDSDSEYIQLGDQMIECSKDFKFYITTRMHNPHYTPEVSVKVR